jgi:phosphoribosylanthranilate isomerase
MTVRVKICGFVDASDLLAACEAGADAVGLNFHPSSPRRVDLALATSLLEQLPPFVEPVGVWVSRSLADVRTEIESLPRPLTVQMHGQVEPISGAYIPAFAPREQSDLQRIDAYLATCRPVAVLVDGYAAGLHGGTGQRAPWDLLADWKPAVPVILAGGLTPENVAQAVRRVRPYAVDVAGGVESAPGRKCPQKVRQFIEAAKGA